MKEIFMAGRHFVLFCNEVFVIEAIGGVSPGGKATLRISQCGSSLPPMRVLLSLRNEKAVYRLIRQLSLYFSICFEEVSPSLHHFIAKAEQWQQIRIVQEAAQAAAAVL